MESSAFLDFTLKKFFKKNKAKRKHENNSEEEELEMKEACLQV